jgi:hypothetical protein
MGQQKQTDNMYTDTTTGQKYYAYDIDLSWKDAKQYCENKGFYLATITSQAEDDFIKSWLPNLSKEYYWLGGTDEETEGIWKWITGEEWSYQNWASGEPNNVKGVEHYLHIFTRQYNMKWNDIPNINTNDKGFICESN